MGMTPFDLWAHIEKQSGCWLFTGRKNRDGYGAFSRNYRNVMAHRAVYEEMIGLIPKGKILMHSCDVPACCNPDHLVIGSHQENQLDKFKKGRQSIGEGVGTSILTEAAAREIRAYYAENGRLGRMKPVFAKRFGVSKDAVYKAAKGINWKWL